MGLFGLGKKPWKDNDPRVRMRALRELDDSAQAIFADVLRTDTDAEVRSQACARVQDERLLAQYASASGDAVADIAASRLNNMRRDKLLKATAASAGPLWEAVAKDAAALTEIACQATDVAVRGEALKRLGDAGDVSPAMLARIAIQDDDGTLAEIALGQLDRLQNLKEVGKKAKVERIRTLAQQRHAELLDEARKPSDEKLRADRRKQLDAIVHRAGPLALSQDWEASASGLAACHEEIQKLLAAEPAADDADNACVARLEKLQSEFAERRAAYDAEQAEIAAAEKQWQALFDEASAAVAANEEAAAATVAEFAERRTALPHLPADRQAVWDVRWRDLVPGNVPAATDSSADAARSASECSCGPCISCGATSGAGCIR